MHLAVLLPSLRNGRGYRRRKEGLDSSPGAYPARNVALGCRLLPRLIAQWNGARLRLLRGARGVYEGVHQVDEHVAQDPDTLGELCQRHALEMDPSSIPSLIERFDLRFPAEPLSR